MANTQSWTPEAVAKRFEEAVDTLNRLPETDYLGYARYRPESLTRVRDCLDEAEQKTVPPSPDAIDRMEAVLEWVTWVSENERQLIWMRAHRVRWKVIIIECKRSRCHVMQHWKLGIHKITIILNYLSQVKNKK